MDKGRPFTFLDHALKCGDSLVGASQQDFLNWAHLDQRPVGALMDADLKEWLEAALQKRRALEAFTVRDVRDAEQKAALLAEAELTVTELCAVVQLPQSTVSRHLKTLADDGWVTSRRDGTSRSSTTSTAVDARVLTPTRVPSARRSSQVPSRASWASSSASVRPATRSARCCSRLAAAW
jgi:DNA-binding transcriptional ArsR family regulator